MGVVLSWLPLRLHREMGSARKVAMSLRDVRWLGGEHRKRQRLLGSGCYPRYTFVVSVEHQGPKVQVWFSSHDHIANDDDVAL